LLRSLPQSMRFVAEDSGERNEDEEEEEEEEDEQASSRQNQKRKRSSQIEEDNYLPSPITPQTPFRSSNGAEPSLNLPMPPETRQRWEKIADIYQLEGSQRASALRTCSITGPENQFFALVCLLHRNTPDISQQHLPPAYWKPSSDFGASQLSFPRLLKVIRKTLSSHKIEAYTAVMDSEKKDPIMGSFYKKAMEAVIGKSPSWKAENLPKDFGKTLEDLTNHDLFMQLFREKLRHVRDELRVILLTGIHVPKAKQNDPLLPIPNLFTLQGLLTRWFHPTDKTNKEIDKEMDSKAKARFAYLAASYKLRSDDTRRKCAGKSHWDLVDDQLALLRTKDKKYRKAFDVLVLDKDQGFFNGRNNIAKIKERPDFRPPTDEEVKLAAPFMT
ncbi:hypothetical protein DFH28DRAFT_917391, partial [Melampsora americana]